MVEHRVDAAKLFPLGQIDETLGSWADGPPRADAMAFAQQTIGRPSYQTYRPHGSIRAGMNVNALMITSVAFRSCCALPVQS